MHSIPFVDLGRQISELREEIDDALDQAIGRADFILGEDVAHFEHEFASYLGAKHAVGVHSGLEALVLALQCLDIQTSDEVVLPANTFIATALAVSRTGARPVLVDCETHSYNCDPDGIEDALTRRTAAIIAVHLGGFPADMSRILAVISGGSIPLLEDAAQAHGATLNGQRCGSIGTIGCFSFYPSKNLGAFGDAGLVATNDDALAKRVERLRNYGQEAKNDHVERGTNSRLDSLQAAILRIKVRYLDEWNQRRRDAARVYREELTGVGDLSFQQAIDGSAPVYHLFTLRTGSRDQLRTFLSKEGISTGIYYPVPIHLQDAYADLNYKRGSFPVAEALARETLSLPMFPEIRKHEIERVAELVREFFGD